MRKTTMISSIFSLLCATLCSVTAQTQPLEPKSLDAIDAKPTKQFPKFIPKGAGGPVVEKGREYRFVSKGALAGKGARVVTLSNGTKIESPLVDIPLLFQKNRATLGDGQSRANLRLLADKLRSLTSQGAKFCIEGHASAEGDVAHNQELSDARAAAIRQGLIDLGVSPSVFTKSVGFGSKHAAHPATAAEEDLAEDRRVLVVREE